MKWGLRRNWSHDQYRTKQHYCRDFDNETQSGISIITNSLDSNSSLVSICFVLHHQANIIVDKFMNSFVFIFFLLYLHTMEAITSLDQKDWKESNQNLTWMWCFFMNNVVFKKPRKTSEKRHPKRNRSHSRYSDPEINDSTSFKMKYWVVVLNVKHKNGFCHESHKKEVMIICDMISSFITCIDFSNLSVNANYESRWKNYYWILDSQMRFFISLKTNDFYLLSSIHLYKRTVLRQQTKMYHKLWSKQDIYTKDKVFYSNVASYCLVGIPRN
jgi:hypothetical protein